MDDRKKVAIRRFRAGAAGFSLDEYMFWIACILIMYIAKSQCQENAK